jgi:hypothetical protein
LNEFMQHTEEVSKLLMANVIQSQGVDFLHFLNKIIFIT